MALPVFEVLRRVRHVWIVKIGVQSILQVDFRSATCRTLVDILQLRFLGLRAIVPVLVLLVMCVALADFLQVDDACRAALFVRVVDAAFALVHHVAVVEVLVFSEVAHDDLRRLPGAIVFDHVLLSGAQLCVLSHLAARDAQRALESICIVNFLGDLLIRAVLCFDQLPAVLLRLERFDRKTSVA